MAYSIMNERREKDFESPREPGLFREHMQDMLAQFGHEQWNVHG